MKKKIFGKLIILISVFLAISCQEEEPSLGATLIPSNLVVNANVLQDQSGNITVTPTADNAINFHIIFTPGADPVVITPETLAQIAGGDGVTASSKRWVWDENVGGHFGVGPLTNDFPEFFSAGPSQLNPCLYDDVLVFSHNGNDSYSFTLEPGADNQVFINWTEVNRFFPDATPQQFADECHDITDQASFSSNFVIIDDENDSQTLDVGNSFLSYWAVIPGQYEIMELSENRLAVRGLSQPFNGDGSLAWYSVFIPEDFANSGGGNPLDTSFSNLVWSDEFDVDGAPNPNNWTYDLGVGNNGWGNAEKQSYTDNAENVIVEGGNLKITAKTSGGASTKLYYYDDFQLTDDTLPVKIYLAK